MNDEFKNRDRLTLGEVASMLDVHISTVWRWVLRPVRGRKLRSHLVGARQYVDRSALEEFLGDADDSHAVAAHNSSLTAATRNLQIDADLDAAGI